MMENGIYKGKDAAGAVRPIDILFFDLDGTLVDSKDDIVSAVNHTLREMKKNEKPYQEIISYIGTGVKDLIRQALEDDSETLLQEGLEIFKSYFNAHYADKSTVYPNARETLEYFKDKKLIVVTNRASESARATLKKFDLIDYFSDVKGGDDETCLKPDACPISSMLNDTPGEREKAIMIGDMDIDVHAGKKAGILTCGVTYGIGTEEALEKAGPDYLIDDLIRLKYFLK